MAKSKKHFSVIMLVPRSSCTGTTQECELPTASNNTPIIVAVVVPVVVVGIVFSWIMWMVWKRNKKEIEEEDNDPEFHQGDVTMDVLASDYRNQGPLRQQKMAGFTPPGALPLNPFETASISEFPNSLQNNAIYELGRRADVGGYRMANYSSDDFGDSQSELRVPSRQRDFQPSVLGTASMDERAKSADERVKSMDGNTYMKLFGEQKSETEPSQEQMAAQLFGGKEKQTDETAEQHAEHAEHTEQHTYLPPADTSLSHYENYQRDSLHNGKYDAHAEEESLDLSVQEKTQKNAHFAEPEDEDDIIYGQGDEDMKRLNSVYQVYFDRSGTVRRITDSKGNDVEELPEGAEREIRAFDSQEQLVESTSRDDLLVSAEQVDDEEDKPGLKKGMVSSRVASSIYPLKNEYEESAQQYDEQQHHQQQYQQQYAQQQYEQQYAQQQYAQQQYQRPQHSGLQPQHSGLQPQHSGLQSQHSGLQSQHSGSAGISQPHFDPLDMNHYSPTQQAHDTFETLSPHHLRESIVMTSPMALGDKRVHTPEGGFRSAARQVQPQGFTDNGVSSLPAATSKDELRKQLRDAR